ncbi:MAG: hypothetical protein WCJ56_07870 [bacterium]
MRRYRIFDVDFDSRPMQLDDIPNNWEEKIKEQHRQRQEATIKAYSREYGENAFEAKLQNIKELGNKPVSIIAFHNRFHEQARRAFIIGAYYPALTGACALGERILNHLILLLRDDYRSTHEYKRIYKKDSFDDWKESINILESWRVLLPEVASLYREFARLRHHSIHFKAEIDFNDRQLAKDALSKLSAIINGQFSGFGLQPWFISDIPGEIYIKKIAESWPFVKKVYLPNCHLVGPNHTIHFEQTQTGMHWTPVDENTYDDTEITDEEFIRLRCESRTAGSH